MSNPFKRMTTPPILVGPGLPFDETSTFHFRTPGAIPISRALTPNSLHIMR